MASGSHHRRVLLGVHVTAQAVAVVLAGLGFATVLALAVLSWLENIG